MTTPTSTTPEDTSTEDRFARGARVQAQLNPGLTEELHRALAGIASDFAR